MRNVILVLLLTAVMLSVAIGQGTMDSRLQSQLQRVFPEATRFSPKEGSPPHFTAYTGDPSSQTIAGYVFWTTELEPLERGYDGPIKILVGMDMKGILKGVLVVEHHEPYGDFSVEPPEFAAQFRNKNIRDPFKVGNDIDAVSRASITMASATRAIRNSARRIARQLLTPPGSAK